MTEKPRDRPANEDEPDNVEQRSDHPGHRSEAAERATRARCLNSEFFEVFAAEQALKDYDL
jgi:hypothetical protein